MNVYALVILTTLLVAFFLELVANLLNLKALKSEVPPELAGLYDPEAYGKAQEYTRAGTRFGFVTSSVNLVAFLVFWFVGGFPFMDEWVKRWGLGTLPTGLLFITVLMLLSSLLSLPFRIYSTFVIEERFGFNQTTAGTFVLDRLKGFLLFLVLGLPLLAMLMAFLEYAGPGAWLYCWLGVSLFLIFVQLIVPTWIMPLFNKFEPLEEGEVRRALLRYAGSVGFPLEGIFVMDGSRRSRKSNAFVTGLGKHKRIALFDTLIKNHTVSELVAVLAHEVGHYKRRHILQGTAIAIVHMGIMLGLMSVFLSQRGLFEAFYVEEVSVHAGLIFFAMLYTPVELILSIFMNLLSRKNELEADRYAAETIEDPESMVEALKKMSVDNLTNLTPHPVYVFLEYSHPPLLARIHAIGEAS